MKKEDFLQCCQKHDIDINEHQMQQLETYMHLLQEWNQKMNLTSIDQEEEIWEKHFLDSILPFSDMSMNTLCDIGTGAGFPGIPVSIVFPNVQVTLVEPLSKRCRFLQVVKEQTNGSFEIINERAEDYGKTHRECYDVVTSRAVARLTILLELCIPFVKENGFFVALKGKNGYKELDDAKEALHILKTEMDHEKSFLIDGAKHVSFYFKKKEKTPRKYPRIYGQIKKKPLGE